MRFLVLKKKSLLLILVSILSIILLSIDMGGGASAEVYFGTAPRLVPIYSVETDEKKVAISFDTAWGADKTLKIIEILKDYNVDATFFMVGFWVDDYPDMVRAIDEAGIEIGTHSNTHPDFTTISMEQMRLELESSVSKITSITNKPVKLFRAPYGAYNNTVINIADEMELKTIQWSIDTLDWKGLSGVEICERVMSKVDNGSIILCHNNADNILDALPLMLERLINAGYEVCSVGELIIDSDYYIDNLGTQRKIIR